MPASGLICAAQLRSCKVQCFRVRVQCMVYYMSLQSANELSVTLCEVLVQLKSRAILVHGTSHASVRKGSVLVQDNE